MTDKIFIQNRPPKSPAAAGILSGFFPGAGQLYNGEAPKALIFFLIFAGCISMMPHGPMPFLPLVFAAFYVYQIIEAVQTASAINRKALNAMAAAPGDDVSAPPVPAAPIKLPAQGSAFWGLLLMGLGVVFLLANFDVIAIDRIWDFWPVIVIVIGLKMIFDYSRKKD
jgi:TM2 domain-containing membrane protein YozV